MPRLFLHHMAIETFLLIIILSFFAGILGAILGLGGGIILVPGLTLLFGYDVKVAVAASLISVIATSSSAATVYVAEGFSNIRLGMLLEVATTIGALSGGLIAIFISNQALYLIFAAVLLYSGFSMLRGRSVVSSEPTDIETEPSSLSGEYIDPATGKTVSYVVDKIGFGLAGSAGAGILSGLLGVGGGIIKVPIMNLTMRIPMKAAVATSNFMIGVTAAAGAFFYWANGFVRPEVAAPTAIGVLIGARLGTRIAEKFRNIILMRLFVVIIAITAVQMILKGLK